MRSLRFRHAPLVLTALLALVASAGCDNGSTTPTPTITTENFTGTLGVLGSDSKRFTVNYTLAYTDASVTVTALTTAAGAPVSATIGVAFGQPAFDGSCATSTQYSAAAATIGQELVASGAFVGSNIYCIKIYDSGTLTEATNYTLTVKHF